MRLAASGSATPGSPTADNLNPIGRIHYNGSTFLYVPNALSQTGGYPLGAQGGEAAIRQLVIDAGFIRFRRTAEYPSTSPTRPARSPCRRHASLDGRPF